MVDLARDGDETGWRSNPGAVPAAARTAYARLSRGWAISDRDRATALPAAPDAAAERVASVDAVRGFAMFFIVAGDALAWALHDMALGREGPLSAVARFVSIQLQHAPWEGFRFYDFLFPLFIFVTGISIVFSLPGLVEREGEWAAHKRVLRRSFLLFVLGLIYYGGAGNLWPEVRLVGVLQRIALCYLFVSLLFLHLNVRGLIVAFVSLLIMTFVSVPEVGAGSFTREANLARWIDAQYLPGLRLYGEWDPEGLLSTPPAVGTCLLGVFAGLLLRDTRVEPMQKALWLMGAGVVLVEAGYLWGLQFPVIKYIWTSSFVLVAGGYSALLLGMSYLLLDICGRKAWATVFLWFGANAILLYMFNNMVGFQNVAYKLVGGDIARFIDAQLTKGAASFVNVTVGITLAILLARYFYRRKIFLRV